MIKEISQDFVYFDLPANTAKSLDAVYVQGRKCWKIPITLQSVAELLKHFPKDNDLNNLYNKLFGFYSKIKNIKLKQDTQGSPKLRPYQRVDIEVISNRQSVGIFNEQRTGKTPTIITASLLEQGRHLIVCPSGLKINWFNEYKRWTGRDDVLVATGTPKNRQTLYKQYRENAYNTLIISYETLRKDVEQFKGLKFDVLIVDEAHRLRNYNTKQSHAVIEVGRHANKVYPMTGTPSVNHPSDVFGIFKLMRPTKYTSFWNFSDRYFTQYSNGFGRELGAVKNNRKSEFQDLLNVTTVQRKRRDVMQWIPKVETRVIELENTPKQKSMYQDIVELMRLNDEVIPNAITQLMRLRQVALDPTLVSDTEQESPKLNFILEYLEDNPDAKVLVFSMFTSFLKRVEKVLEKHLTRGRDYAILTGEQTTSEKQRAVELIQQGGARVLLSNIVAGGVGWTLDKIDTIIFTDVSYTPMENDQAKDRFIPTDPNAEYGAKQIIYLQMQNSIDLTMHAMLKHKVNIIKYVNDYGLRSVVNFDENAYNKLQEKMEE